MCHGQALRTLVKFLTSASESLRIWLAPWKSSLISEQELGGRGFCAACEEGFVGSVGRRRNDILTWPYHVLLELGDYECPSPLCPGMLSH